MFSINDKMNKNSNHLMILLTYTLKNDRIIYACNSIFAQDQYSISAIYLILYFQVNFIMLLKHWIPGVADMSLANLL